jgi:hypothetical protein
LGWKFNIIRAPLAKPPQARVTVTANGKYRYDMPIKVEAKAVTLHAIQRIHQVYSVKMGWSADIKLVPCALAIILRGHHREPRQHQSLFIVAGVRTTRGGRPRSPGQGQHRKPYNDLADARYVKCAAASYDELPEDEQLKDVNLATSPRCLVTWWRDPRIYIFSPLKLNFPTV